MNSHSGLTQAGPLGPVSVFAAGFLLLAAPLMRGGNRHLALMTLEAIGTIIMLSIALRSILRQGDMSAAKPRWGAAQWLLLSSPALLALIYLVPMPVAMWAQAAGRDVYLQAMRNAGATIPGSMPLSVVPDATLTSLLAGIPLVAAFLLGQGCTVAQLRWLARAVVFAAAVQVLIGLLQLSGGENSPFLFGFAATRPIGTFANSNHLANYLAGALVLYIWLAWEALVPQEDTRRGAPGGSRDGRRFVALWVGGGLVLVVGILMTRSRGAVLTGLPVAALAAGWLLARGRSKHLGWRRVVPALAIVLLATISFLGVDVVLSRFAAVEFNQSASFRSLLTLTTLAGAAEFWPWGAGWGVYGAVYPRFQPPEIPGTAGYAHQDYVQMLFEGGVFALVFAGAFVWLVARRIVLFARLVRRKHRLRRESVAAALCGLGLLGFLAHSLVEFNMHIPANAILASLLAGVFLRPLADAGDAP
ncbi:O-antigen ligase [Ramlibacter sp. WS9]|uniref:O-antigen ligase family protein n=1 Tax=Ramlibacter sp. WS9 TaxID=1882741 RepID=UPI001141F96A|nr:O-antigen ligase family protein [Ramlibacter sp. WS9]ROZ66185.1 O-antigen ligase domain-containing protein [Ramlibacter sp. WS9]